MELELNFFREETDDEMNKRIDKENLKNKRLDQNRKIMIYKKEKSERETYERLKKKFEV